MGAYETVAEMWIPAAKWGETDVWMKVLINKQ